MASQRSLPASFNNTFAEISAVKPIVGDELRWSAVDSREQGTQRYGAVAHGGFEGDVLWDLDLPSFGAVPQLRRAETLCGVA